MAKYPRVVYSFLVIITKSLGVVIIRVKGYIPRINATIRIGKFIGTTVVITGIGNRINPNKLTYIPKVDSVVQTNICPEIEIKVFIDLLIEVGYQTSPVMVIVGTPGIKGLTRARYQLCKTSPTY